MTEKEMSRKPLPPLDDIAEEMGRLQSRRDYRHALSTTIYTLLVVAAVAVLISMLYLPVMKVTGTSMEPNLNEGEILVALRTDDFETGDICSFYYNNRLLIKRVIASAGDWVEIDTNGYVYVNGEKLDEPYIDEFALGFNDQEYPYQVPEGRVFVLGDHRSTSIDSRSDQIGTVSVEDIVGKVAVRIWPLTEIRIF